MKYYIGIDLGGTNIAVGVVDEQYQIVGKASIKTNAPRPGDELCDDMVKACMLALENAGKTMQDVESIGVGAPGTVNSNDGVLYFGGNIGLRNFNFADEIGKRTGKPVFVECDANAAVYAEMIAGAAKGVKDVVMITLGTGVGGGIIIDGKIFAGHDFGGGELGHVGMVYDGEACTCGRKGCIEAYCSATALIRQTKRKMNQCPDSKMWQLVEGDINKASGRTSFEGMRAGDEAATQVVEQYTDYLAFAIGSLINAFQPQVFMLGGGISKEGDFLIRLLEDKVKKESFASNYDKNITRLTTAKLGNDAGIIGAAFLGLNK